MFDRYADELRAARADRVVAAPLPHPGVHDHACARGGDRALARRAGRLVSELRGRGPEVEVVLKSSDPDLLAAARAWLEDELDRLT